MLVGETVPPGISLWLEGLGPPVELDSRQKLRVEDISDGDGLRLHGKPSSEFSKDHNDLAEAAYLAAKAEYDALPHGDKLYTSPGAIAMRIYKEMLEQNTLGVHLAAQVAAQRQAQVIQHAPEPPVSKIVRQQAKTSNLTPYVPYDLGLPGLGSVPSNSGVDIELSYFLASGESTTAYFTADWVVLQYEDFPKVWALVFDSRRKEVENLPVVPKSHEKCRLVFSENGQKEAILISQSILELDIGKLKIWVVGESDG